ncbi:hypothetical protein KEM48_009037 [Puccinia striiformis f. sp. tritici PST-130]|nr:hypothetical protein KEM48_009037 [Puccinia striiformis f. sp. tritici PST-130]
MEVRLGSILEFDYLVRNPIRTLHVFLPSPTSTSKEDLATKNRPALLVVGSGLWFLGLPSGIDSWKQKIDHLVQLTSPGLTTRKSHSRIADEIVLLPVEYPAFDKLNQARKQKMHPNEVKEMNAYTLKIMNLISQQAPSETEDGLHYSNKLSDIQARILFNLHCNDQVIKKFPLDKTSLIAGIWSGVTSEKGDLGILNREQTDEWKGWMQVAILIYHYLAASQISGIYNPIRICVASYLFMTGLNLLTLVLAYVMDTDYLSYYFSPLVSMWFIIIWVTMFIGHQWNDRLVFLLPKLACSIILIVSFFKADRPLQYLFGFINTIFGTEWIANEWKFRVTLDIYIVYWGMITSLIYLKVKENKLIERDHSNRLDQLRKSSIWISLFGLIWFFWFEISRPNKLIYNLYHPYISIIPIASFIILRNSTEFLRSTNSKFFVFIGQCSLETFIIQFHFWLGADTKGILKVLPFQGHRLINLILSTTIFIFISYQVAQSSGVLTSWLCHKPKASSNTNNMSSTDGGGSSSLEAGQAKSTNHDRAGSSSHHHSSSSNYLPVSTLDIDKPDPSIMLNTPLIMAIVTITLRILLGLETSSWPSVRCINHICRLEPPFGWLAVGFSIYLRPQKLTLMVIFHLCRAAYATLVPFKPRHHAISSCHNSPAVGCDSGSPRNSASLCASAAATPSIEGLVEGESGGVVASRAPLESNVRPSARGGVLGTESEESERLDIGNRPVVDSSLEHTDGRTINDKPKENQPIQASSRRSSGDVTGKAKSSPSDRHLHAEMHVPPGASAAQYAQNISYPQTHYMEQPGGSSGHGYERYTQSHQPGGAGQFQNYGPINIPHEVGICTCPDQLQSNQVATPSASTPYEKGTKRLIPSELDQKKIHLDSVILLILLVRPAPKEDLKGPWAKVHRDRSRQVTPVILKRPSDKSLAKKSIAPSKPEVTQPAAEPRLSSPVMSGDHSGITSTEKMEISSPRNKAINPPKAAQPAAESCSPVMSRDHSGVTSTGKIETRSPRNKAINPVVLSDAPDSHLLLSPDQPKAVQPAAESLLSSPAMSGGITSTGKIETRSPRNKAINPVTPSEAPDSHLIVARPAKSCAACGESRLSSPVMFGDHSGVTSTGKIEISSPCNKAINPVTPSEAPDSHLLMSPDQPEAKAINPVTPRDVPSEGTTPSSSGAILSWAEASSERDSSSLAGSSKAKGSVSKSGSENEAANDPAASLEEALRRGKAQLLNGSPQDQMRFVESLSSRISEPKNNKKSTQQNVFFSGNAESYIRPRTDKEKWIEHRSSLQDSHTTDTNPKGEPGNSVHNRQTRNPAEGHAYVRGAKRLSISQKKNKFELLSQHVDSDPEEESLAERLRRSQPGPSTTNDITELSGAEIRAITESASKNFIKRIVNPFILWETRAIHGSMPTTKGLDFLSRSQTLLRKQPNLDEKSEETKPLLQGLSIQESESSKKEKDIPRARFGALEKNKMLRKSTARITKPAQEIKVEQRKGKTDISKAHSKTREQVSKPDGPGSSSSQFDISHTTGAYMKPSVEEKVSENGHYLKEMDPGGNKAGTSGETSQFEKKYAAVEPNLSPSDLRDFRLLGHTLRADNKGWDFSIGLELEGMSKRQLDVLKCNNPGLKRRAAWLQKEVGFPEGSRRFEAIQRQIRSMEIAEAWREIVAVDSNQRFKAELIEVDRILRLKTLKGYLAEYHVPKDRLISLVDPNERKLELPWNPWWNLGHILTWEEQGLDSFLMAKVGIKMRMKKGQKELLPEQNQILENLTNMTHDQREKVISWFHEEFNKSPQNEVQPMQWYSSFIAPETLSDINTWYKARSTYLGNHPEGCFQIFLDI